MSVVASKARKYVGPTPVTVDFETFGIMPRRLPGGEAAVEGEGYPPEPVGVAIKWPGKPGRYYAWGHPTGNNCSRGTAMLALRKAWAARKRLGLLFQNAKFDVDVAEAHCGLPLPAWDEVHDTLFLIFLDDPNQRTFSLKPTAERLLKMKPEEQDAVADWLMLNQPLKHKGVKISRSTSSEHYFGRYIAYAPGDVVGKYAVGDVVRTERLFDKLHPKTAKRGMLEAYDRERRLMPILLEMERDGVPVDLKRLRKDVKLYRSWLARVDAWLVKRLGCSPDVNLDSGQQLIEAALAAGLADRRLIPLTATGKLKTDKAAIKSGVTDRALAAVLKYRTQLNTCLHTFMEPWLETATASGGLIFTSWNQVKSDSRGGTAGARTGRLSSTPNFQNIPKEFAAIFAHEEAALTRVERKGCPALPAALRGLPSLPLCRRYVVAFEGHVLIDRDYSQQEPRILAHFDGGELMRAYLADAWIDFHDKTRELLAKAGLHYPRKQVKNTGLGIIYGMGVGALAERNGMTVEEAKKLKDAILRLYPGLREIYDECKARAREGKPVRTWGGREYHCEEPKLIDGRMRTFEYKLPNALIQGSAADCTKAAVIEHHARKDRRTKLLLTAHDELLASTPVRLRDSEMEVLRAAMESVEFDVPILSEGTFGDDWFEQRGYDAKGKRITTKARAA